MNSADENGTHASRALGPADLIAIDPAILAGKPVVRGTRLSVEFVIGLLADGWSARDIISNYPQLDEAAIRACLAYARDMLGSERVFPSAA